MFEFRGVPGIFGTSPINSTFNDSEVVSKVLAQNHSDTVADTWGYTKAVR